MNDKNSGGNRTAMERVRISCGVLGIGVAQILSTFEPLIGRTILDQALSKQNSGLFFLLLAFLMASLLVTHLLDLSSQSLLLLSNRGDETFENSARGLAALPAALWMVTVMTLLHPGITALAVAGAAAVALLGRKTRAPRKAWRRRWVGEFVETQSTGLEQILWIGVLGGVALTAGLASLSGKMTLGDYIALQIFTARLLAPARAVARWLGATTTGPALIRSSLPRTSEKRVLSPASIDFEFHGEPSAAHQATERLLCELADLPRQRLSTRSIRIYGSKALSGNSIRRSTLRKAARLQNAQSRLLVSLRAEEELNPR